MSDPNHAQALATAFEEATADARRAKFQKTAHLYMGWHAELCERCGLPLTHHVHEAWMTVEQQAFVQKSAPPRMTLAELLDQLQALVKPSQKDPEKAHGQADKLLLEFINNHAVREAYDAIEKWYS